MKTRLLLIAALLLFASGCAFDQPDETLRAGDALETTAVPENAVSFIMPENSPAPSAENELLSGTIAVPDVSDEQKLAVMRALFESFDGSHEEFLSACTPVEFCASAPFSAGSLVVAMANSDGESAPELFYIVDGSVRVHTVDADGHSINMARLDGYTVLFGARFDDGRGDTIEAAFFDGTRVSAPLASAEPDGVKPGFLLISPGTPDLSHLTVYEGGQPVADERSAFFACASVRDPFNGALSTLSRVHFCRLYSGAPLFDENEVRIIGNEMDMYDWEFMRFVPTCGCWSVSDAWRNNCALDRTVTVPGGTTLPIENLPDELDDAYFVYTALDDGSDHYAAFTEKTNLVGDAVTLPRVSEKTFVTLVAVTPGAVYALPFVLE